MFETLLMYPHKLYNVSQASALYFDFIYSNRSTLSGKTKKKREMKIEITATLVSIAFVFLQTVLDIKLREQES